VHIIGTKIYFVLPVRYLIPTYTAAPTSVHYICKSLCWDTAPSGHIMRISAENLFIYIFYLLMYKIELKVEIKYDASCPKVFH